MGDYHVRFCERLGVKLPLSTRHINVVCNVKNINQKPRNMKKIKLFHYLAFTVLTSILLSNKLFSQDNYLQENIKNWVYYKNSEWELIFKDKQTEYYLRLNTRASDFGRTAYLIAIHTVKDDDTPLYPYNKLRLCFLFTSKI